MANFASELIHLRYLWSLINKYIINIILTIYYYLKKVFTSTRPFRKVFKKFVF